MRKQLTDQQVDAFRTRLIRTAEKLFARHGVAGVTMRQIARALGYSQTAAYRYFANKNEILAAVRTAAMNRFCAKLEGALDPTQDARANARSVGNAFLQFALDHPDSYRLIFDTKPPEDAQFLDNEQSMKRFFATMTDYVRGLIDEGVLVGDADSIGRSFCVAAHGVVMMHLSGFLPSVDARDELHRATMRLIYQGARAALAESKFDKKRVRATAKDKIQRRQVKS
jgi:AcrR family transcriptional regulator